ncbi:MAG TPA: GNAT family N-acetyltransferase [Candidatus Dormibacteraeota bacterium]|jgi:putative acetyltransferase|nr:GNAT family N-acetyltransferase [Candidatus Dormibacteraeota bacterium]
MDEVLIRDGRDDDAWDLVGLVGGCWAEYPGCVLDVHGEAPELLAIATYYADHKGRFWIVEAAGRVVGSIGTQPAPGAGAWLLQKLYIAPWARRQGLGRRLVALVEDEVRGRGGKRVELWTDTRFVDAHRLYEACGYHRGPATRDLHDLSQTTEFFYDRTL